jgi:hypothetical protein
MDTVENNKKDTFFRKFCSGLILTFWVSDCCLAPFQLYHDMNKLIFNEMMTRSALY